MILYQQIFFTTLAFAFGVLHLILFLYNRRLRSNLYFSIFVFLFALNIFFDFQTFLVTDLGDRLLYLRLHRAVVPYNPIFALVFLYVLFEFKIPKYFWVITLGLMVTGFFAILSPVDNYQYIQVFFLAVFAESLRILFQAFRQKKEGVWIIAIGFLFLFLFSSYDMLLDVEVLNPFFNITNGYPFGFVGLIVSMSLYLAREFARAHMTILAQERQAKEREIRQKLLEKDLTHKAKELEEARKLAKALADLEEAHAALKSTQAQLVQSEKMASLGMLVAGIAHDINTPVGAAKSMHDTLIRALGKLKQGAEKQGNNVFLNEDTFSRIFSTIDDSNRVIQSANERVAEIVRRLKSFVRLDEAELSRVDIHVGLEDTLSLMKTQMKPGIRITKQYGNLPHIACFPAQLNQVFMNVLMNAEQAIEDKGEIKITTFEQDRKAHIVIRDSGRGISKENMNKIFDPGFTTKGVGVGTGLGLSICYRIMQSHKGEIKVDSEKGIGTTVTIILPTDLDRLLYQG